MDFLALSYILKKFNISGSVDTIAPAGSGHINDTFIASAIHDKSKTSYVLQRINHFVFKEPEKLMDNMIRICSHLKMKIIQSGGDPLRETLTVVNTIDNKPFYKDNKGNYWRLLLFIKDTKTFDKAENNSNAVEAARAFALFQKRLLDLPGPVLYETIPHFHDTPIRIKEFESKLKTDPMDRAREVREDVEYIRNCEEEIRAFFQLVEAGAIPRRIAHNDTKINNVLIDSRTQKAICVIDLDTVMPGISIFDFGDLVRSATNLAQEDEPDISKIGINLEIFEGIVRGYLENAAEILTEAELENLAFSARLITLEQAIRFLTDYLTGDLYYKIKHPKHNLERCRSQLALAKSMAQNMEKMKNIVYKYSRRTSV